MLNRHAARCYRRNCLLTLLSEVCYEHLTYRATCRNTESPAAAPPAQSPCRIHAKIARPTAVTNAISTHCPMACSIHEPGGGAPGRMLRSGTMANRLAAYHVANGGRNLRLPRAIGMATNSARVGRLTRTRQIPRSKINGPLALRRVMTTFPLSVAREVGSALGSLIRLSLMAQPSRFPVTSTRAGTFLRLSPVPTNASAEIGSVL